LKTMTLIICQRSADAHKTAKKPTGVALVTLELLEATSK